MRWPWVNDGSQAKWNLRRDRSMQLAVLAFALALGAQAAFWNHSRAVMPEMGIVPAVPGERTVRALSFGDEETFFRLLALNIQNSGDTFGRFTALYKYDFNKLYHWFHLLDGLDNESNYLPSMATYYFSQTQNRDNIRYIVDYLDEHTLGREKEKWWWVAQASYLASHKMKDTTRALELASRLRGIQDIPMWAQQLAAFVHEERGEFDEALTIIQEILRDPDKYSQGELNFMKYFIEERLGKLKEVDEELQQIQRMKDAAREAGVPDVQMREAPPPNVGAPKAPM